MYTYIYVNKKYWDRKNSMLSSQWKYLFWGSPMTKLVVHNVICKIILSHSLFLANNVFFKERCFPTFKIIAISWFDFLNYYDWPYCWKVLKFRMYKFINQYYKRKSQVLIWNLSIQKILRDTGNIYFELRWKLAFMEATSCDINISNFS